MLNKRRKVRGSGPLPFRYVFLISFIIFIVLTVQGLWIVEKGLKPTLMEYAKIETQRIATLAINDALTQKMTEEFTEEELVKRVTNQNGDVASIEVNQEAVLRMLAESTIRVQNFLKSVEEGTLDYWAQQNDVDLKLRDGAGQNGIIHYIPIGQAFNNSLLANLGPQIPVRFTAIGEVNTDIVRTVEKVGINSYLLDISVQVVVDVRVVIPFATETEKVKTSIPVVTTIINGEVPNFYNNGGGNLPNPSIDVEDLEN
ncbi:sporulation protein YunB [Pseudalkalibacillus caeni]|uniref:Sporulation protein YunB n=1 Tax=Exobacillus caeni TaxID=2574798 RepID=A0A5R9F976_9BACL|nr:sporulation protein YunB [Pseudalkalibacillus caeni]TLS38820.1 sporulation protein YunB [Pseudalkalibacillus caeni]